MRAVTYVSELQAVWIGGVYRQPPMRGIALWFVDGPTWTVFDTAGRFIVSQFYTDVEQKPLPQHVYWTEAEAREDSISYTYGEIQRLEKLMQKMQQGDS